MASKKSNSTVENISSTKNPNKKKFSILERIKKTFTKPNKKNITQEANLVAAKKKTSKPKAELPMKVVAKKPIAKLNSEKTTAKPVSKSVSKKPIEIRMGKGKGNVDHWVAKIKYGSLICQIETRSLVTALKGLKLAQLRLPFNTKIVYSN